MAVRVSSAMSPGLSASIAEMVAMSDLAFCKRFRSSYESSPSSSPLELPSHKHSRGTSELVEDKNKNDEEEDEEVEKSSDSDSKREDTEDEGGDEDVPEGQHWEAPVMETAMEPSIVPSSISSHMIPLTVPSPVASPAMDDAEGFLTELGAQSRPTKHSTATYVRYRTKELLGSRTIKDLGQRHFGFGFKHTSLEFRFVTHRGSRGLEITCSCFHGFIDKDLINLVIPDIVEERRALLDLAEIVNSMRRGKKHRGDV
nr:hypothetical protein [Tanacetum cinerariifolium]